MLNISFRKFSVELLHFVKVLFIASTVFSIQHSLKNKRTLAVHSKQHTLVTCCLRKHFKNTQHENKSLEKHRG